MGNNKIKGIISESLEIAKDSARQIADTVSPGALLEKAIKPAGQTGSELTQYLQQSGPNLSKEELQKKEEELSIEQKKELEEARKILKQVNPSHMRLPVKPAPLRPYEQTIKNMEEKTAMQVEAQKKQSQQLAAPTSKPQRGMLGARRKQVSKGFEGLQKDTKVG